MAVVTATEFNHRPSAIKQLSDGEPVFITDRGSTTTVIMSMAEYDRLRQTHPSPSLGQVLVAADDIELDVQRDHSLGRVPDLGD